MSIAKEIVGFAIKAGSSDIHLEEGSPIAIRVNSDITILDHVLRPSDMDRLLLEIVGEEKISHVDTSLESTLWYVCVLIVVEKENEVLMTRCASGPPLSRIQHLQKQ